MLLTKRQNAFKEHFASWNVKQEYKQAYLNKRQKDISYEEWSKDALYIAPATMQNINGNTRNVV